MTKKAAILLMILLFIVGDVQALNRLIIKYKPNAKQMQMVEQGKRENVRLQMMMPLSSLEVSNLSRAAGMRLKDAYAIGTGAHVVFLDRDVNESQMQKIIKQIKTDPNVEYVEEDVRLKPSAVDVSANPNWQWDMMAASQFTANPTWSGDNFVNGWSYLQKKSIVPGQNIVVAVVDTGYTPHPNFISALQSLNNQVGIYGYQFISDCRISGQCPAATSEANADISYQQNGLDLGDYVTAQESSVLGCNTSYSTWHGSHVIGTIGASGYLPNESSYIAGGAYGVKIVPVRALGKCGGYLSDISNAIIWVSGGTIVDPVSGSMLSGNPNPAQVINLSLDGASSCTNSSMQSAIDTASSNGSIIVVAAGNSSNNISGYIPAGCKNVISVAARGPSNTLSYYSNYGDTTIASSGGDLRDANCVNGNCLSEIYSTVWSSLESYQPESQGGYGAFVTYEGTSMASPHVAAAVADIIGILRSRGQSYTLSDITTILQKSASSYNNCSFYGCASGGTLNAESSFIYASAYNSNSNNNTESQSSSSGGGGCSMIAGGNDYSLLLILFGLGLIYIYKYKKVIRGKGK